MYLKTSVTNAGKYINLILHNSPRLACQACLKKREVELELWADFDILLLVEKGIKGGIHHGIHKYAKANNNYMKDSDPSTQSSHLM